MTVISDGKGSGNLAYVDEENHLHVSAINESQIGHRSHYDATAFGGSTPLRTLTTTGGEDLIYKKHKFYT